MEHKNAWLAYDEPQLAELEKLATNYIDFISANKTERECVATAIEQQTGMHFTLVHYSEHALDNDTDSRACCYVGLKWASGKETWGCGTHTDIIVAGIRALVSAINNQ